MATPTTRNADGSPHGHTTNPVPVVLVSGGSKTLTSGILADVAPTILELMEVPNDEMTGKSLLRG